MTSSTDIAALCARLPDSLPMLPSGPALEGLALYLDMLQAWNSRLNLVGFSDRARILEGLVCDSFYLADFLQKAVSPLPPEKIWDFGSGAGLPGIPLRLVWTSGVYTMVEIRQKRSLFIANALARLNIPDTHVFKGGVENFLKSPGISTADIILSRAFMPWPKLLQLCGGALAKTGRIVVMASGPAPELPSGWNVVAQKKYMVFSKDRWLWALARQATQD